MSRLCTRDGAHELKCARTPGAGFPAGESGGPSPLDQRHLTGRDQSRHQSACTATMSTAQSLVSRYFSPTRSQDSLEKWLTPGPTVPDGKEGLESDSRRHPSGQCEQQNQ